MVHAVGRGHLRLPVGARGAGAGRPADRARPRGEDARTDGAVSLRSAAPTTTCSSWAIRSPRSSTTRSKRPSRAARLQAELLEPAAALVGDPARGRLGRVPDRARVRGGSRDQALGLGLGVATRRPRLLLDVGLRVSAKLPGVVLGLAPDLLGGLLGRVQDRRDVRADVAVVAGRRVGRCLGCVRFDSLVHRSAPLGKGRS